MFLDTLRRRNPSFLAAAVELHQSGRIPGPGFVLDLDAMAANAEAIVAKAKGLGLITYAMTKQFGRCPAAMDALAEAGVDGFVAVDMGCATAIGDRKSVV